MFEYTFRTCAEGNKVGPRLCQAELVVWTSPDLVRIRAVLSIVVPETDLADLILSTTV
jgi:hypothetical protein